MATSVGNRYGRIVRIAAAAAVVLALAALPGAGAAGGMFRAEPAAAAIGSPSPAPMSSPAPSRFGARLSAQAKRDLDMAAYLSAGGMALMVGGSDAARGSDPIEGLARLGARAPRDPDSPLSVAP
jgi:hypothetical protein